MAQIKLQADGLNLADTFAFTGTVTGAGAALTGSTNNTVTTVTGANAIQGEANLTFDGTTLAVTGDVGIGIASPAGALDIPSGSYTATKPAIMLGGDIDTSGAGTRTDNTRKYSSIVGYHYSNEEEPVGVLSYDCSSDSTAIVNIGIPSASYNSPTLMRFLTGATSITAEPTERMRIDSNGFIYLYSNGVEPGAGQAGWSYQNADVNSPPPVAHRIRHSRGSGV
ncbi:MAG: hypothetical protein QF535_22115, partial [Anaerolineales bacterium]|nr:hypothetical protein [Anaerolineales bacterium]